MFRRLPENAGITVTSIWKVARGDECKQLLHSRVKLYNAIDKTKSGTGQFVNPDVNPMENLRRILTRDIYANGRQFATVQELKLQIERS